MDLFLLACYKGHLEMVRFLLASGADQVSSSVLTFVLATYTSYLFLLDNNNILIYT